MAFDRTKVLNRLNEAALTELLFMKLSGEEREMIATLNPDILSEKLGPDESAQQADSPDLITVYDIEAEGFRSFYLENLITIDGVDPEPEA